MVGESLIQIVIHNINKINAYIKLTYRMGKLKMEIKLYVANLGKYNEGILQGEWFTLPVDMKEVAEKIGLNEVYEEWAIHDYEAPFKIEEYNSIDKLNEVAEQLQNLDEEDSIIESILGNFSTIEEGLEILENRDYMVYVDCKDMTEVAYEYAEQTDILEGASETIARYFDYEAFGRDMGIEGTFIDYDNGIIQIL